MNTTGRLARQLAPCCVDGKQPSTMLKFVSHTLSMFARRLESTLASSYRIETRFAWEPNLFFFFFFFFFFVVVVVFSSSSFGIGGFMFGFRCDNYRVQRSVSQCVCVCVCV